jgi:hypothetical protein
MNKMKKKKYCSSTNKTDCHNRTEILLKMALNIITLTLTNYISLRGEVLSAI